MTRASPILIAALALSIVAAACDDDAADPIFTTTTSTGIGCGE